MFLFNTTSKSKPWWTKEVQRAHKEHTKLQRRHQQHHKRHCFITNRLLRQDAQEARADFKDTLRKYKNTVLENNYHRDEH